MNRENGNEYHKEVDYSGCVIVPFLLPIYLLFHYYGENVRGMVVCSLVGIFIAAIYKKRNVMFELYFAVPVILLFCVELFISLVARMPKNMSYGIVILPFAIANIFLIYYMVDLFKKIFNQR